MATDYLEVKKANDCQTRTLVHMCHNYKNIALVMETFTIKLDYGALKIALFYRSTSLNLLATIQNNTIFSSSPELQKKLGVS